MKPVVRKVVLILYAATLGALLVDYVMGFGWFHGYDTVVTLLAVAVAHWVASRVKSRAEKAQTGDVVVEALDSEGAVHSDPNTRRFVLQVAGSVIGISVLVCLGFAYRDRGRQDSTVDAVVLLMLAVVLAWVLWPRYGNLNQVESDDGVTLTLRKRGQTRRVPWSQVESVEVGRPYAFWQVLIKFRLLGQSKVETVRFLPRGWRKMTPAAAEKLQRALEARRIAR